MRELRSHIEEEFNNLVRQLEEGLQREVTEGREKVEDEIRDLNSQVKANIARLAADDEGTIIMESNALHACACNLETAYVEMLLEFVPNSRKVRAINCVDQYGKTPLMTAASSLHFSDPEVRFQMCDKLIQLNADKNMTDEAGRTALGHFRMSDQSMSDFNNTFGMDPRGPREAEVSRRMETLLMPLMGPTPADAAKVDDH